MIGKDKNSLSSEGFYSNFKFELYYAIGMPSHSAQDDYLNLIDISVYCAREQIKGSDYDIMECAKKHL